MWTEAHFHLRTKRESRSLLSSYGSFLDTDAAM